MPALRLLGRYPLLGFGTGHAVAAVVARSVPNDKDLVVMQIPRRLPDRRERAQRD